MNEQCYTISTTYMTAYLAVETHSPKATHLEGTPLQQTSHLYGPVTDTYHHADVVLLSPWCHFQSVIHHQVHERVKSTQDALNMAPSIKLY